MIRLNDGEHLPQGSAVATIGMFDGVHLGHVSLVDFLKDEARRSGLRSLVITFSRHPQEVLGGASQFLLQTIDDRLHALAELNPDYLLVLDFTPEMAAMSSEEFLRMLRDRYGVKMLVVGYNHRFGHERDGNFLHYTEQGMQLGVEVKKAPEYLGEYAPVSSTIVRGLIAAGRVADAMHSMARPYRLSGQVVHGFHNGRGIGFPTANVGNIDPMLILPHNGAYAVMVHVAGRTLKGMVNIGNRPTLNNGPQLSVEVNIFDFDEDIYGQDISLDFIGFLRLEFKMGSVEELRAQLTRDKEKSLTLLNNQS